ncbi:zinc finger protein [Cinnamomum micranthum f. kanehirae]|uniref:Zinc finger protein n=1 Tax=Cinnamomum micranthum f. kanehirae TaxID=337451 RepID=A0A443P7I7_9MAGN|nr:zinc finger protein [Cinnamomum micranthum f. kanehirae]
MMSEEEEEALVEIEAVQAVYGSDCHVIQKFPPHINVDMKPRTADDSSQQFVEAILGIRADAQYPQEPPGIVIIESNGLDEKRQAHLISVIQDKGQELASFPMLVALCEEAVDTLSNMNHPDGDCPLCLYPLVTDAGHSDFLPFMKLMSCFHCFHSECIVRWWRWLQEQNESPANLIEVATTSTDREDQRSSMSCYLVIQPVAVCLLLANGWLACRSEMHGTMKQGLGNCPVCRKVFHTKDIEHVLDLVGTSISQASLWGASTNDDEMEFLQSEMEHNRRQKYEAVLKLQEENRGLIEPRRNDVLLPGMFLPEPVNVLVASAKIITDERQDEGFACNPPLESDLSSSSSKPSTSKHHNASTRRKNRGNHPRKQINAQSSRKQWIKKEKITSD